MKPFTGVAIDPAQVRVATAANCDLPRPAGEPRERSFRCADVRAAWRRREATDVMHDTVRVHERMFVRPRHRDAVFLVGDAMAARGAHDRSLSVFDGSWRGSAVSLSIAKHDASV